jgi:hypothetical protein
MTPKDLRNGWSATRIFALACPIAMLLLTVLAWDLFPGIEAGASERRSGTAGIEDARDRGRDATSTGRDAAADRTRMAGVMLDLMNREEFDCEQTVRLLLGLDEEAMIDNEQIVRLLLGIDEGDDLDRGQIIDLLESVAVRAAERGSAHGHAATRRSPHTADGCGRGVPAESAPAPPSRPSTTGTIK